MELGSTFLYLKGLYPGFDSKGGKRIITLNGAGGRGGVWKVLLLFAWKPKGSERLAPCCDIETV